MTAVQSELAESPLPTTSLISPFSATRLQKSRLSSSTYVGFDAQMNGLDSSMSSNGTAREERSPHDETPASKRRRIAFSCLDCRRRKLKCDRIYPSCTRCQKGGQPQNCTYDTEAVDTLNQSSGERTGSARDFSSSGGLPRAVPRLPSVARSFAGDDGDEIIPTRQPDDATARLYAQDERIRQLENRIIGLERVTNGNGRVHWPRSTRSPELTQAELKPSLDPREAVDKESMIFRGKGFKTQFYGASYHMSYLSHVRPPKYAALCCEY